MKIPAQLVRRPVIKKSWRTKSDPQAHLVYRMERDFIGWSVLTQHTQEYLDSVAKHVCAKWKVPVVKVLVSSRPKDKVYGRCHEDRIWLNSTPSKPGNNLGTLIHELAHWVADHTYPDVTVAHGEHFVYVYGKLLDQYKLFPFDCYKMLCVKHNVAILEGD